jgi:hypothetical protein
MRRAIPPLSNTPWWRGAELKQRGSLSLNLTLSYVVYMKQEKMMDAICYIPVSVNETCLLQDSVNTSLSKYTCLHIFFPFHSPIRISSGVFMSLHHARF